MKVCFLNDQTSYERHTLQIWRHGIDVICPNPCPSHVEADPKTLCSHMFLCMYTFPRNGSPHTLLYWIILQVAIAGQNIDNINVAFAASVYPDSWVFMYYEFYINISIAAVDPKLRAPLR